MKRVVWIISEGSPGHISQSEGLVTALAERTDLDCTVIQTRQQFGGFIRTVIRRWMGPRGRPLSMEFLKRWLQCEIPITVPTPDLIVASGGKSVFAARSLAARLKAPLVFIGERKPYPSEWFHTVLTPSPFEDGLNDIPLERIPTRVTREHVEMAAASWLERPPGRLWTMIVGGASASHRYADADWIALARGMNAVAKRENIHWLITTSRRTGSHVEGLLRGTLDSSAVADAIWWSSKPEKRLHAMLGAAEIVFVTQDSITMLTEAISSGLPVEVIHPATVVFAATSFIPSYLQRLETAGWVRRRSIDSLVTAKLPLWRPNPSTRDADIVNKLLVRLTGL